MCCGWWWPHCWVTGCNGLRRAAGHPADPPTRESAAAEVKNKCFPCEYRAGAGGGGMICGTWRCPLPPQRYAALAGTQNIIELIDHEWWNTHIEPAWQCPFMQLRRQVAAIHVCGEEITLPLKPQLSLVPYSWPVSLHRESSGCRRCCRRCCRRVACGDWGRAWMICR